MNLLLSTDFNFRKNVKNITNVILFITTELKSEIKIFNK